MGRSSASLLAGETAFDHLHNAPSLSLFKGALDFVQVARRDKHRRWPPSPAHNNRTFTQVANDFGRPLPQIADRYLFHEARSARQPAPSRPFGT
jgi:hypothetical protein